MVGLHLPILHCEITVDWALPWTTWVDLTWFSKASLKCSKGYFAVIWGASRKPGLSLFPPTRWSAGSVILVRTLFGAVNFQSKKLPITEGVWHLERLCFLTESKNFCSRRWQINFLFPVFWVLFLNMETLFSLVSCYFAQKINFCVWNCIPHFHKLLGTPHA